ncbi:MAG: glycosyltransferase family 2 protein [Ginsengibacter sp.]
MQIIITILVTYNGEKWINQCIECILRSSIPTKLIIVDNASTDSTKTIIRQKYPELYLVENNVNTGFGQANNIGINYALSQNADFVFLVNQDAYLNSDTLEKLLIISNLHPEYGIISPLQMDGSGNNLDMLFRKFISNNYSDDFIHQIETHAPDLPGIFPVRFVNATAWFITKKCLQTTGLFNPIFYHYGEDNHYCSRAQYHGFKVGISTDAKMQHDKIYDVPGDKLLLRKIQLDPLYILLDIRRNLVIAYLLVFWKLIGYTQKGISKKSKAILKLAGQKASWVFTHFSLVRNIRRESKVPFIK